MNLQPAPAIIVKEAQLSEPIHEETDPRPGCAYHLQAVVCGTVNLGTRFQQGFWNAFFWTLASWGSGDHVTDFERLDRRVLSAYPLRTPFTLSPQSYL